MSDPPRKPLLGRLAVHLKMITLDQLAEATREQARRGDGARLGDLLLELGFVTQAQLARLVRAQQEIVAKQRARQAETAGVPPQPAPAARPAVATSPAPVRPAAETPARAEVPLQGGSATAADPPAQGGDPAALEALLRDAVTRGASDIHVHAGLPLRLRLGGRLADGEAAPLAPERTRQLALGALRESQRERLESHGELDFCYTLPGVGRFRSNAYRQQRGVDAVFRFLPPEPPTLEQLGLPSSLARFTNFHQGMVLVTGPKGCGKSSTLAALVNLINEERREHILTIEDPIEYLHVSKRCLVNQRSVGPHTESFARALRAALREDPDVIVIGELRDLETISLALTAAETGHFVLATLHTGSSIRTLDRLVGAFPADQQGQVRTMLSESLRAVVSQRLLARSDGTGRVAALETLVVTKAVGNLIRENKTFQIGSILQTGAAQGMALLDTAIRTHVQSGAVDREEALRHCEDPRRIAA